MAPLDGPAPHEPALGPHAPIARRRLIKAAAALPLAAADAQRPGQPPAPAPLRAIAAARGLTFGAETTLPEIDGDPAYRALFARECGMLVPGREAKWDATEPAPGRFCFDRLDRLVTFGTRRGIALRMHTLVWSLAMPTWLVAMLSACDRATASRLLERHVAEVVGRYRGRVAAWDVVNEMSDPLWRCGPEGLTLSPWRRAIGPEIVPLAFAFARAADPGALLFINEDGLEYRGERFDAKRATYLRLVESWKRRGVPIDGFGLQTHLTDAYPLDLPAYRHFLATLAGMGLVLHLTELDVRDRDMPAAVPTRDAIVAGLAREVLDAALDERAVRAVLTWGLSDRTSYQNSDPEFARADGLASRGLPYDQALQPKPFRAAIAAALAAAPVRGMPA